MVKIPGNARACGPRLVKRLVSDSGVIGSLLARDLFVGVGFQALTLLLKIEGVTGNSSFRHSSLHTEVSNQGRQIVSRP